MNEISVEAVDLPDPFPELTQSDRCDQCGAQAYYRYLFTAGDLLFCQHHQRDHESKLAKVPVMSQFSFRPKDAV